MNKGSKALGYEWMVKNTPQEVWIEGKGIYLWLAFFFTEIFAGVCFISLFLNLGAGLLVVDGHYEPTKRGLRRA